jgi:Kef-type K+ transport system membrane component KefB
MEHDPLLLIFIVFLAGVIGGELSQRLRLPEVVGQVVAGVFLGPTYLGLIKVNETLEVLSEVGAMLLLFLVGLETSIESLRRLGRMPLVVGSVGVAIPFVAGFWWAWSLLALSLPASLFVGAAFVATSAGITAKVLRDIGVLDRDESKVILGAAIVDDVLGMLVLGVVAALQTGGEISVGPLLGGLALSVLFIIVSLWVGAFALRKNPRLLDFPLDPLSPLTVSLLLCLGLSVASAHVGLAAIIGAFIAGVIVAEYPAHKTIVSQVEAVGAFLIPFFFVVTGAMVSLGNIGGGKQGFLLVIACILAVISKFVAGFFGARRLGNRSAVIVGVGMVPRGEVGILIATIGRTQNVFGEEVFGILIAMSLVTSLIVPPLLRPLFGGNVLKPSRD